MNPALKLTNNLTKYSSKKLYLFYAHFLVIISLYEKLNSGTN